MSQIIARNDEANLHSHNFCLFLKLLYYSFVAYCAIIMKWLCLCTSTFANKHMQTYSAKISLHRYKTHGGICILYIVHQQEYSLSSIRHTKLELTSIKGYQTLYASQFQH